MSTTVAVNTYTHTATYLAAKMMLTLKEIIRESGLDPLQFSSRWKSLEDGVAVWMRSRHLQSLTLEVYSLQSNALAARWDLEISYTASGDSNFWTDTDLIRYSIAKVGLNPRNCGYRFVVFRADGAPKIQGWSDTTLRSTEKFARYSIGSQIGAPGASVETSYWLKK